MHAPSREQQIRSTFVLVATNSLFRSSRPPTQVRVGSFACRWFSCATCMLLGCFVFLMSYVCNKKLSVVRPTSSLTSVCRRFDRHYRGIANPLRKCFAHKLPQVGANKQATHRPRVVYKHACGRSLFVSPVLCQFWWLPTRIVILGARSSHVCKVHEWGLDLK